MVKKFFVINCLFLFHLSLINAMPTNFKIIATVDSEVVTNFDVDKEARYLRVLNPKLKNLDEIKIFELAEESLIRQIIKKKEIDKYIDLSDKDLSFDEYIDNLILRLGYESLIDFDNELKASSAYSLEEVKNIIKIEVLWNDLIFQKYNNQITINKNKIKTKLDSIKDKSKEVFLSEIIFKKINGEKIEDTIAKIKRSINEIGFNNTASVFSLSESSKFGGKIGWVDVDTISEQIYNNISDLKNGEYSKIIKLNENDNYLILMVENQKFKENRIDKKKEMKRLIEIERNEKLEKFSRIYFNKIKTTYLINEK
jgi:peptidyl-prolyl cis-trans isomerase SurA